MQLLRSQGKVWNQEHTSSTSRKQTVRIQYVLLKKKINFLSHSLYLRFLSIWHWESCYFQMHNVLWTCKQTKHCRYIKTQARKGPSATANVFLLTSHVQPRNRPGRYTILCPFLLSCMSFSSLLSLRPRTCTPQTADAPQHSTANLRPLTCWPESASTTVHGGKPQSILSTLGSWKQGDAK